MRRRVVAGNWKMHLTPAEGAALAAEVAALATGRPEVVLCPAFVALDAVGRVIQGTSVALGAQDLFWRPSGAFTGEVSAAMLTALGVHFVIIGHSETRGRFGKLDVPASTVPYFAETDETVSLKLRAALEAGLVPILCVGETLEEREAGQTEAVIASQLDGALAASSAEELESLVVAYEPVWAIGTGQTCDAGEADRVCGLIRRHVESTRGVTSLTVLYGGSVKPENAAELFAQPEIDGGLVGGASLKAADFLAIVGAA